MIKRVEIADHSINPFDYWKCDFSSPKTALPVVRRDIAVRLKQLLALDGSDPSGAGPGVDQLLQNHRTMEALARQDAVLLPQEAVPLRLMWNTYKALTLAMRMAG